MWPARAPRGRKMIYMNSSRGDGVDSGGTPSTTREPKTNLYPSRLVPSLSRRLRLPAPLDKFHGVVLGQRLGDRRQVPDVRHYWWWRVSPLLEPREQLHPFFRLAVDVPLQVRDLLLQLSLPICIHQIDGLILEKGQTWDQTLNRT